MRIVLACALLAACATAPAPPPQRLAGCWANRDVGAVTMRWYADTSRPGALRGAKLEYRQAGPPVRTAYALEPSEVGWSFCELGVDGAATRCWRVAQGESGSLDGGRVFIDAHGDRLRIAVVGDGPELVVFHGRRDGCD